MKQENNSPASHSEENTSDERANSDLLKDACKQRSVAVGEVVDGIRSPCSSSQYFESENSRTMPSIMSCSHGKAGDAGELKASMNFKVEARQASVESNMNKCQEKVTHTVQENALLQEELRKAWREDEGVTQGNNTADMKSEDAVGDYYVEYLKLLDKGKKLLQENMKRSTAWVSGIRRTSNLKDEEAKIVLQRIEILENEKRILELQVEQTGASEKAKVAKEIQSLQEEKKELRRQLKVEQNRVEQNREEKEELRKQLKVEQDKVEQNREEKEELRKQLKGEQNRVVDAQKELKIKVRETDEMVRQTGVEKTKMKSQLVIVESQLEGVKESFSLEQSKRAADEKETKRLVIQVESLNEQLRYEQGLRKAAEEKLVESKRKEAELSNFFQQLMGAGDTFLRSRQGHEKAEQNAVAEERRHGKQGADVGELQGKRNCTSHERLVEKLLKQIKQPPMTPVDCNRLVQQLRASRGGLSGLPMEEIEEEVRRMAKEEAEVKAKECPICFDPMISKILCCKQCNQAFHSRSQETN